MIETKMVVVNKNDRIWEGPLALRKEQRGGDLGTGCQKETPAELVGGN